MDLLKPYVYGLQFNSDVFVSLSLFIPLNDCILITKQNKQENRRKEQLDLYETFKEIDCLSKKNLRNTNKLELVFSFKRVELTDTNNTSDQIP